MDAADLPRGHPDGTEGLAQSLEPSFDEQAVGGVDLGEALEAGGEELVLAGVEAEASGVAVLRPEHGAALDEELRRGHGRDDAERRAEIARGGGPAQLARVGEIALPLDAVHGADEGRERGVGVPLGRDDRAREGGPLRLGQRRQDGRDRPAAVLDRLQESAESEPLDARHSQRSLADSGPVTARLPARYPQWTRTGRS